MPSQLLSAAHILRLLIFYGGYYLIILLWSLSMLLVASWFPLRQRVFCCLIYYLLYELWLRLCLNIRIRYDYESPLPKGENYLIMANHQAGNGGEAFAYA